MTAHLRSLRPSQSPNSASRRDVLLGLSAALATTNFSIAAAPFDAVSAKLALVERETGGRIGLAACSGASGSRIDYRTDERFAMCSTFKLMLAAAILTRVDAGQLRLDQRIRYTHDKTGTGERGANNDLAIFWPPAGAPLLIACYLTGSQQPTAVLNAAHARSGAAVAEVLS